jgi:DNA-binding NarL/FixJ family response regulator
MRRTLRNLLETQEDWKVCDEASDGREAVAKFDKDKFDVIVLDFQMPGMNGLDAAKANHIAFPEHAYSDGHPAPFASACRGSPEGGHPRNVSKD